MRLLVTFLQNLDRAAAGAVCNFLSNGGNIAATNFIVQGALVPGGAVPAAAAGLGLLALNAGCAFDPNKQTTHTSRQSCWAATGDGYDVICLGNNGSPFQVYERIISGGIQAAGTDAQNNRLWNGDLINTTGQHFKFLPGANNNWLTITSQLRPGASCTSSTSPLPPAPVYAPTYNHTDTECNIKVEHLAWRMDPDGNARPVLKMSSLTTPFASGGIISGCNFNPVIYVGGGGGSGGEPPHVFPWTPGPDGPGGLPWWVEPVVRGVAGAATSAAINAALDALFPKTLPATVFRLVSACETAPDGSPLDKAVEKSIPALPVFEALDARLHALADIAQGLKTFKQPICRGKPLHTGQGVTVGFISDEPSPASGERLRKTFSYRDQAGSTLEDTVAHWEHFSWQAGPVCVSSTGGGWGEPQVWAATAAEGRRVIQHAATIAGVDLTQPQHQWQITASDSVRLGMPGTMRTRQRRGVIQVSMRPGSGGMPLKAAI